MLSQRKYVEQEETDIVFVPLNDSHQVFHILSPEVFHPLDAILLQRIEAEWSDGQWVTLSGIRGFSYRHVLEQNTDSVAGFLFRKTVFKHAYPEH